MPTNTSTLDIDADLAELLAPPEDHKPFVTVASGMRGFFAVLMFWDDAHGGFWDAWQTGIGSYKNPEGAAREGRDWATAEELEFKDGKS